jgi:tetratricopeptide (TPR) repeat protein
MHGYAYWVRGPRTFEVHASVSDKVEGSAEAIQTALKGFTLGPETGACVLAEMVSRRTQLQPDDPAVLGDAAKLYLQEDPYNPQKPAIAAALLQAAIPKIPGSPVEKDALKTFEIHHDLGLALLTMRKADEAIGWFAKAVELAAKTNEPGPRGGNALYNLACAQSVAGKLDDAFATLDKAFEKMPGVVSGDHLRKDPDLDNLRKDPRWEKFISARGGK